MTTLPARSTSIPFRPRARLLLLLGDQLIRDPRIAVFELVKNSYDADATFAKITLSNIQNVNAAAIVVEDDGSGMSWETVTGVWLEPGTDYRVEQSRAGTVSPRFHRRPLGEKGIGRFGAHKLGNKIRLITRKMGELEVVVSIDWTDFESKRYLEEVHVEVGERTPALFTGERTGTRIEITGLREPWTRGMVRDLQRSVTSICSPFGQPEDFHPTLILEPPSDWLAGLLDADTAFESAMFSAECDFKGDQVSYQYRFTPLPGLAGVNGRTKSGDARLPAVDGVSGDLSGFGLGPFKMSLRIFDRDAKIMALTVSDRRGLRSFLDQNGGIRVYRDRIRVFDYGEPGTDWLQLDVRRVNIPAERISNNIVIGAVLLDSLGSSALVEKTNREGFVENPAFLAFRSAVLFGLQQVAAERNIDKARIRRATSKQPNLEPVLDGLNTLRKKVEQRGIAAELGPDIDEIEKEFISLRDRLIFAAGSGLSLAVVIHEVEKGVSELTKAVERIPETDRIRILAIHLSELIAGFAALVRKSGLRNEHPGLLIRQALFNCEFRLQFHNITAVVDTSAELESVVKCSRRLSIATIMNLIDNSIYWLDNKFGGPSEGKGKKEVYLGVTRDLDGFLGVVVADTGPGFQDPPEYLVQPFFTRKPDGMGLGLHLANEVMKAEGGRLVFPQSGDITLPPQFTGAVVVLAFPLKP